MKSPSAEGRAALVDVSKFLHPEMALSRLDSFPVAQVPPGTTGVCEIISERGKLNDRIVEAARDAIEAATNADLMFRIKNNDRAAGFRDRLRSMKPSIALCLLVAPALHAASAIKVLIVDGQNNHKWQETTPILKKELESTGKFQVDVTTSPAKGEDMSGFKPNFSAYKVVLSNYSDFGGGGLTHGPFVKAEPGRSVARPRRIGCLGTIAASHEP